MGQYARSIKLILLFAGGLLLTVAAQALFPQQRTAIWIACLTFSLVLLGALLTSYLQPERKTTPQKDVVEIFIKIASSVLLVASVIIAWISLANTQLETSRNLELSQTALENTRAEQRSQRFVEALEKLGGNTVQQRLAGIHGFEKLDSDFRSEEKFYSDFYNEWRKSPPSQITNALSNLDEKRRAEIKEHLQVMDILTKFIKTQAPWSNTSAKSAQPAPRQDIEMILRYLGERKLTYTRGETEPLNLSETDLRGYVLNSTTSNNCNHVNARKVNFEGVNFGGANLENIELQCAKLKGAVFWQANLKNAKLANADLTDADFTGTNLQGANLEGAIIQHTDLDAALIDAQTRCPSAFATTPTCVDARKPETCKCEKI